PNLIRAKNDYLIAEINLGVLVRPVEIGDRDPGVVRGRRGGKSGSDDRGRKYGDERPERPAGA
ncbi:MAG TPA: hypothetical protein PLE93_07555, partial [Solirubrobacterales bacterium]|nr:hypothetical protein [Solirubrobacterales bacterium]